MLKHMASLFLFTKVKHTCRFICGSKYGWQIWLAKTARLQGFLARLLFQEGNLIQDPCCLIYGHSALPTSTATLSTSRACFQLSSPWKGAFPWPSAKPNVYCIPFCSVSPDQCYILHSTLTHVCKQRSSSFMIMIYKQTSQTYRGSNLAVNVVNWFQSGLTFVHGALCYKMHKINENGFCNKMLCLQFHTKNAAKFFQVRGPPKRAL